MTQHLVVTKPFLNFVRGDIITDTVKVGQVLATELKRSVTIVTAPNPSKG